MSEGEYFGENANYIGSLFTAVQFRVLEQLNNSFAPIYFFENVCAPIDFERDL